MRNRVILHTDDGESYYLAGFAREVSKQVNEARGGGKLISLERDAIPTGQLLWVDPDRVTLIKDDR